MAINVNKVEVNGQTIVDLTADTVDAEHLAVGYTAHDKSGALIVGTLEVGGASAVNRVSIENHRFSFESGVYPEFRYTTPEGETAIAGLGDTVDIMPGTEISLTGCLDVSAKTLTVKVEDGMLIISAKGGGVETQPAPPID